LQSFDNNLFQIELPPNLKQRSVHDVFHSSLLRIHVPNDDRRFPGRLENQLGVSPDVESNEWPADKILSHHGRRKDALFEVLWQSGDRTWVPYDLASQLTCFNDYLDALGVKTVAELPYGSGRPPADDAQIFAGGIRLVGYDLKSQRLDAHSTLLPTSMSPKYTKKAPRDLTSTVFDHPDWTSGSEHAFFTGPIPDPQQ
jgi:hypothetical protein